MKIGFIGSGTIAEILSQKILESRTAEQNEISIYDINKERTDYMRGKYGLTVRDSENELIINSDYIFMCVRSDNVIDIAKNLSGYSFKGKTIVSISSGIPMSLYENNIPEAAVARALPNPPSRIGRGVIAVAFNKNVTRLQKDDLMKIFNAMGACLVLPEDKINAVTSLTGPGPVYAFFQALVESSILLGIDHKTSAILAHGTIKGCLKVWEENIDNIGGLLTETSTPGGISVRQLYALEQKSFKATVKGCYEEGFMRTKAYSDNISRMLEEK